MVVIKKMGKGFNLETTSAEGIYKITEILLDLVFSKVT